MTPTDHSTEDEYRRVRSELDHHWREGMDLNNPALMDGRFAARDAELVAQLKALAEQR